MLPVLRALADAAGRPDPMSVTVHYLRPAARRRRRRDHDRRRAGRPLGHQRRRRRCVQDGTEPRLTVAAILGDLSSPVSDAPDPGLDVAGAGHPAAGGLHRPGRAGPGRRAAAAVAGRGPGAARRRRPTRPSVDGWIRLRDGTPPAGDVAAAVRRRLPAGRARQGRAGRLGADAGAHRPRPAPTARRVDAGPHRRATTSPAGG